MRFTSLILAAGLAISAGASVLPIVKERAHHGGPNFTPTFPSIPLATGEGGHHHHHGKRPGGIPHGGGGHAPIFPLAKGNQPRYPYYERDVDAATPTGVLPRGVQPTGVLPREVFPTGFPFPVGGPHGHGHGHGHEGGGRGPPGHTEGGKPGGFGPGPRGLSAGNYDV